MSSGLKFKDFGFDLPQELFVNDEYRKPEEVRLIVVDAKNQTIKEDMFSNIVNYFGSNDLLVFNDTGISPSRFVCKLENGDHVDVCFLREEVPDENAWEAVVLYENAFPVGFDFETVDGIKGTIVKKTLDFDGGYWVEKDRYKGLRGIVKINVDAVKLRESLNRHGKLMHPWYANINNMPRNLLNPPTSPKEGGVLLSEPARRFSLEMLEILKNKNVSFMNPSLKMSFSWQVVEAEKLLSEYQMCYEEFEVNQNNIDILIGALKENKRIISIGTSGVRILESISFPPKAVKSKTNIFISPGFKFKYTDGLLTNLHNSMGTHVIMASAFGGKDLVIEACNIAVKKGYRFGIHGDSMLILGNHQKPILP